MNDPKNYYALFGLTSNKDISDEIIEKIYNKKIKECHPDLHRNDPKKAEEFSKYSEAYEHIKNSKLRNNYEDSGNYTDMFSSEDFFSANSFSNTHGFHFNTQEFNIGEYFNDIFDNNFNGSFEKKKKIITINIPIKSILLQEPIDILIEKTISCTSCKGGYKLGETYCENCSGKGYIQQKAFNYFLSNNYRKECSFCKGGGRKLKICNQCSGKGCLKKKVTESVRIPKNVIQGSQIRLKSNVFTANIIIPQHFTVDWETGRVTYHKQISLKSLLKYDLINIKNIDGITYKFKIKPKHIKELDKPIIIENLGYFSNSGKRADLHIYLKISLSNLSKETIQKLGALL